MRNKEKEKIIDKVLNGDIENNLEKEIYLEYLKDQMSELIQNNKQNKKNNFIMLFEMWLDYYLEFSMAFVDISIPFIGIAIICGIIELLVTKVNFFNLYSLKILAFIKLIPIVYYLIKTIVNDYLPNKNEIKLEFYKNKKNLENEIIAVKEMSFDREKMKKPIENTSKDIDENQRYVLNQKEKIKIYEKITNLLIKIKEISDANLKAQFALELTNIVNDFNNARINLENLNPNNHYLILNDKINVELSISLRLDNLERELKNILNKENRMKEDSAKVKILLDELKPLTRK